MPSVLELIPESKTHVIWDFNGTLVNDVELVLNITNDILKSRQLPLVDAERYRQIFEFPVSSYYAKLGLPGEGEEFRAVADVFAKNFESGMHDCALRDDALPCFEALGKRGTSSSLLSASRQASLMALAEQFELTDVMTDVCGIDDHYAHGKVESGQRWLAETGRVPGDIVVVGDTAHDYEVAPALGAACILVSVGHSSREKLEKTGCPIADSLC
jgi:phosphoglycolate phosphatase